MQNLITYMEGVYKVTSGGLLLFNALDREGELDTSRMYEDVKAFYDKAKYKKNNKLSYIDIQTEEILNYDGTNYIDDNLFDDDIKTKQPLKELEFFLNNCLDECDDQTIRNLLHCFNELDRNVRNHSGYKDMDKKVYLYNANYYKARRTIHFSILDDGQGFEGSIGHQAAVEGVDPVIYASYKYTTSGSNHTVAGEYSKNSGYGLYMLTQLSRYNGNKLTILSGGNIYESLNGELLKNMYSKNSEERIKKYTLITITIAIDSIDEAIKEISTEVGNKSGKSSDV